MNALTDAPLDLQHLFNAAPGLFLVVAPDSPRFSILAATDAYLKATKKERDKILGRPMFEVFPDNPDDLETTATKNTRASLERAIVTKDADVMPVQRHDITLPDGRFEEHHWSPVNTPVMDADGKVVYLIHRVDDVTETVLRQRKEVQHNAQAWETEELRKLNRTLRALSNSNQALMRAAHEMDFIQEVCEIIVKDCGHAMAWVGYARQDEDKTVEPVAKAGNEQGYLGLAHITWADTERGRGPTGTAIRTGEMVICNNMLTDPRFVPWRAEAVKRGYASSIALPLIAEGSIFGTLTIYSGKPAPFADEELSLLSELAGDLAFGIMSIRLRQAHAEATEALRTSEHRFNAILSRLYGSLLLVDEEGRVEFANQSFCNMFGLTETPEELVGLSSPEILKRIEPSYLDPERNLARIREIVRQGQPVKSEEISMQGDRTFLRDFIPIHGEGRLSSRLWHHFEITDRKRAEQALRESERLYRAIGESIDYGIWICDAEGRNTYASKSLLDLVGITPEQCADFGWGDVLHPDDAEATIAAWKECVRSGDNWYREHRYLGVDGEWHPILACGVPVRGEHGEVTAWAGINLDISQLKQTEQALREREAELRGLADNLEEKVDERTAELLAINEQLQGFTYSVAHDLRQHIRGISTSASLALEDGRDQLPEDTKEHLRKLVNSAKRLAGFVDDMLRYAKLGRQQPTRETVDLSNLANEIVAHGHFGGDTRITVQPGMVTFGDPAMLGIVLQNLIENACKYSRRSSTPTVEVGVDGLGFYVKDNGIGFDMKYCHKVFEPFERLHRGTEYSGTGIGLANVKRILEKHGGSVWAESEPGVGSAFYFTLPPIR